MATNRVVLFCPGCCSGSPSSYGSQTIPIRLCRKRGCMENPISFVPADWRTGAGHTNTERMSLQDEKGVINWKITTVVLIIIFAQQLVCSMLYADSPFLIQEYFPGVRAHHFPQRIDRPKACRSLCGLHRFYVQYRPDPGMSILGVARRPLWTKARLDHHHSPYPLPVVCNA